MRENTKRILTWLYPIEGEMRLVPIEEVYELVEELTVAGRRSLVYHLVKEGLVDQEVGEKDVFNLNKEAGKARGGTGKRAGGTYLRLTKWGKSEIEREMAVLDQWWKEWSGGWQLVILGESPSHDLEFRQLRSELKTNKAVMITRGVYLYPNTVAKGWDNNLRKIFGKYLGSVWITAKTDFVFGDERNILFSKFDLNGLSKSYSGVSRELERLLRNKEAKKISIQSYKTELLQIFNRLFYIGESDLGFWSALCHFDILKNGKKADFTSLLQVLQRL